MWFEGAERGDASGQRFVRGDKSGGKSERKKKTRKKSRASFASPAAREFCVRERGKDRGRRAARTQVLLLELAGQVALHEGGLACVAGKRDASGVCQRGLGDPGLGGRVPELSLIHI